MSEYQYYEFAAVEQPLTPQQQAELRALSTRATITATGFVNEYHWGDLKGDPLDWMQRYFDAHVYSANWGSCYLMLRVPYGAIDPEILADFTRRSESGTRSGFVEAFEATHREPFWILEWRFNEDPGEHERFWTHADGPGWLTQLLPLREELLRGDLRPLYLGWLARVGNEELGDPDLEPPPPPGLASLTPAQSALAEFLILDPDWLAAASAASPPLAGQAPEGPDIETWLCEQSADALRAMARSMLNGRGREAERDLRQRFSAWRRARQPSPALPVRRSLAQIGEQVEGARSQRLERERIVRAAEEAKRLAERMQYLARLAEDPERVWNSIEERLQRGTGAAYDQALALARDLAEAMARTGREAEFRLGLTTLMRSHTKRTAWVTRLKKTGLI